MNNDNYYIKLFFSDARNEKSSKKTDTSPDQTKGSSRFVEKIKSLEMDYKALQEKRLQDVSTINFLYPFQLPLKEI